MGANTYTWSTGATITSIIASPTITTSYSVIGTALNGCSNTKSITIMISACTEISETITSWQQNNIYPNPNDGSFKLQLNIEFEKAKLVRYNSLGQKVHEQMISNGTNDIITNGLVKGLYYYILLDKKRQILTGKIVIDK